MCGLGNLVCCHLDDAQLHTSLVEEAPLGD
uniref:LisH domain and HEAT repeat-containing protein KIAA1468 n=1 Tax=Rhizophora mucronata TaxID=61149 RepID=A0A2P2L9S5_RHIMU